MSEGDRDDRREPSADLGFAPDERDAREADGSAPPTAQAPPRVPPVDPGVVEAVRATGNRWWAAIAVLVLLVVGGSLLTLYNGRSGSPTVDVGERLPPFAAPLATAPKLEHDAVNYAEHADEGEAGRVPACSVENPSVITSCALLDRGPLVLAMFGLGVDECVTTVDDLDRVRGRYPGVQALAVAIGGDHAKTATAVRNRRWSLPVAYDRDGGLSSRLGAPACPFLLFVGADGVVRERLFGSADGAAIDAATSRLAATAERGATAPASTAASDPSAPAGSP